MLGKSFSLRKKLNQYVFYHIFSTHRKDFSVQKAPHTIKIKPTAHSKKRVAAPRDIKTKQILAHM